MTRARQAITIAGLGIVGIAIGFGAQSLVRDYFNGVLILIENQYGKGDVVRIAGVEAAGDVGGRQVRDQPRIRMARVTPPATLPYIAIQVDAHRVTVHPCNFFYISESSAGALLGFCWEYRTARRLP